jgi:hypothetical protein
LDESGNTSADIRISKILGDIEYVEIEDGGTGYSVDDLILPFGDGEGTRWKVDSVDGGGSITSVSKIYSQTKKYTYVSLSVSSVGGSGAILNPYIIGEIIEFYINGGSGYTSSTFNYSPSIPLNDGFVWSGYGTTSGDTDNTSIDISLINPRNEKLLWKHYNSGVLETNIGPSPLTIDDGDHITSLSFDSYGHITDIETDEISIDGGSY